MFKLTVILFWMQYHFAACAWISYFTGEEEYTLADDMLLAIGAGKAGLIDESWPDANVPYLIDDFIRDNKPELYERIVGAMAKLTAETCITFTPRTNEEYWLAFVSETLVGCIAVVGFQNEPGQKVNVEDNCGPGTVVHQIIHALGFFHEHTRDDRDDFVKILYENVIQSPENKTTNFMKNEDLGYVTNYYNVQYNYESIMHYGAYFFSIDEENKKTIVTLNNPDGLGDPNKIGQRDKLTLGDVAMINNKYECEMVIQVDPINGDKILRPIKSKTTTRNTETFETADISISEHTEESTTTINSESTTTDENSENAKTEDAEETTTAVPTEENMTTETAEETTESLQTTIILSASASTAPYTASTTTLSLKSTTKSSAGKPPKPPCMFPFKPPFC